MPSFLFYFYSNAVELIKFSPENIHQNFISQPYFIYRGDKPNCPNWNLIMINLECKIPLKTFSDIIEEFNLYD